MMRSYHLVRYVPDPLRGETINLALVAFVDDDGRVLALPSEQIAQRTRCIAPHVDPAIAQAFAAELTSAAGDPARLRQILDVFNPHVRVEEPRRISLTADVEVVLSDAYRELVAQPAARRRRAGAAKWTVDRALDSLTERAPSFTAHAKRRVSVTKHPELFGLERDLFDGGEPPPVEAFDAVLPNCVRVVALQGLVVSEQTQASRLFETRAGLHSAAEFFSARATSKTVITGALLLPHAKEPASAVTRGGMRDTLAEVADEVRVDGLPRRRAVFDLSDPVDAGYLEQLSAFLARARD